MNCPGGGPGGLFVGTKVFTQLFLFWEINRFLQIFNRFKQSVRHSKGSSGCGAGGGGEVAGGEEVAGRGERESVRAFAFE
jgi:hypothetical protein